MELDIMEIDIGALVDQRDGCSLSGLVVGLGAEIHSLITCKMMQSLTKM